MSFKRDTVEFFFANVAVQVVGLVVLFLGMLTTREANYVHDTSLDQLNVKLPYTRYIFIGLIINLMGVVGIFAAITEKRMTTFIHSIVLIASLVLFFIGIIHTRWTTESEAEEMIHTFQLGKSSLTNIEGPGVPTTEKILENCIKSVENIRLYYICIGVVEFIGVGCAVGLFYKIFRSRNH